MDKDGAKRANTLISLLGLECDNDGYFYLPVGRKTLKGAQDLIDSVWDHGFPSKTDAEVCEDLGISVETAKLS
jgi:hypothetical protein